MRKWASRLVALLIPLALSAADAAAQQRIKIAIWDFENNSERSWWFHDQLGGAARNQLDTAFSENDQLARMFSVIEREKLDLVLKEQGLGAAGALDPQSAAKVGRILGVKYILTGAVDRFSINRTSGSVAARPNVSSLGVFKRASTFEPCTIAACSPPRFDIEPISTSAIR